MDALFADLISGDENLAQAAMQKLAELGAESMPALRKLATSPDPDQRWWAVSTLAQMDVVDVDWLLAALDDESVEVKQSAALGLAAHPHPKSAPVLIGFLRHPDSMLRTLVTNALTAIGTDAVPALLGFLDKNKAQDAARLGTIRALANITDTRAIPALMAALKEDSALIRHWAEIGLENLGLDMVYMKLE
ncbi:MAG: HEAT repeat domain-containing protein [Anaerolineae bacterium]|nr:HEAT repeat domain-containing protein [Anaerolineae bacterium]MBT7071291.1 HEAT repeat domain-containing protein [Anaerolineae bacterium]MBT7325915.1 HEAT repeat domain-containing protein [Anaerolineae bacterium]